MSDKEKTIVRRASITRIDEDGTETVVPVNFISYEGETTVMKPLPSGGIRYDEKTVMKPLPGGGIRYDEKTVIKPLPGGGTLHDEKLSTEEAARRYNLKRAKKLLEAAGNVDDGTGSYKKPDELPKR
jgi:hypothetical protein